VNKKFSHFLGTFCLAAIFGLFARSNINAQVISGDLVGTVLDKTGAAVPGATIDAVNAETGVKHTTKANEAGEYRFTNLPVGAYNVSASAASFATTTVSGFHVELNKTVTLPITLEVKTLKVSELEAKRDYRRRPGGSAGAGMDAQLWLPGAFAETFTGAGLGKPMPAFSSRWSFPHAGQ
jgi:hypothetical protein